MNITLVGTILTTHCYRHWWCKIQDLIKKHKNSHKNQHSKRYWKYCVLWNFEDHWWWRSISPTHKYQAYSDSSRDHFPHSKYAALHKACLMCNQCKRFPIQDIGGHSALYLTIQCNLRYNHLFYTAVLVVLIPPQNTLKMFPQISGL